MATTVARLSSNGVYFTNTYFDEITYTLTKITSGANYSTEFDEVTIQGGSVVKRETYDGRVLVSKYFDEVTGITYLITLNNFNPHLLINSSPSNNISYTNGIGLTSTIPSTVEAKVSPFSDDNFSNIFNRTITYNGETFTIFCNSMHCNEPFYISTTNFPDPIFVDLSPDFTRPDPVFYDTVIYIANRNDSLYGSGTLQDPYNSINFDDVMMHLCGRRTGGQGPSQRENICIYLSAGSYTTCGTQGGVQYEFYENPSLGWHPLNNWTLSGAGSMTTLYLSGTYRNKFFNNLAGAYMGTGWDQVSGFCASNFIIDGITKSNSIKTITSFFYTHSATNPLTVTTLQPHGLSAGPNINDGGDRFSTSNYSWRIGSTEYYNDADYHFDWKTMEVVNDYTVKAKVINGIDGFDGTGHLNTINGQAVAPVQNSPGSPEMRTSNCCPLVMRNSGHTIYQNLTAYGYSSIYENLGVIQMINIGASPTFSKNNLIDNCVVVTIPHPGERRARYGTAYGWIGNNPGWDGTGGSPCWLSMIVTNNLALSSDQAFGGYGNLNTLVDNNTAYQCGYGWFADVGINVGTYITNNKFYTDNWGIFIQSPVWRNGIVTNNYMYGLDKNGNKGGNGLDFRLLPNDTTGYRSFANTLVYGNTALNWNIPVYVDTDIISTSVIPLSARVTLYNNITS